MGNDIGFICMICKKSTSFTDCVCIKCHSLKSGYVPIEQYKMYFRLLAKEKNDNT